MITARRLPWALAAIGAFDGWTIPDLGGLGQGWTATVALAAAHGTVLLGTA